MRTLTLLLVVLVTVSGCGKKPPAPVDPDPVNPAADPSAERAKLLTALKSSRPETVSAAADAIAPLADADPELLKALVEMLRDKSTAGLGRTRAGQVNSTREAAAFALVRVGPKGETALKAQGLPILKDGLLDPITAVREHTAYTLGTLGPTARPLSADLLKLCTDPDANVRGAAFDALKWVGVTDAVGLANLLTHASPDVRRLAAELVSGLSDVPSEAVGPFTGALSDDTEIVRAAAATGLALAGPKASPAVDALVGEIKKTYPADFDPMARQTDAEDAYWRALVAVGEPAAAPLADLLKHTNPIVRTFAARALGDIGPPAKAAAPALKTALTDRFAEVSLEAACSLCRLKESEADAVALVRNAIEAGQMSVPAAAIEVLPRMGAAAKELVPVALAKLTDANPYTRYAAVALVGTLSPADAEKVVPEVAKLAADEFAEVRRRAGATLERLGPAASPAAAALGKALPLEKDDIARDQFVDALAAMGKGAKPAVPALLPLIVDGNVTPATRLKIIAAVALADPASAEVAATLVKAATGADGVTKRAAALALATLNPMPPDAVAALVTLAKTDREQLTRIAAMKAFALAGAKAKAARADVAVIASGENPAPAAWGKVALAAIDGDVTKAAPTIRAGLSDRYLVARTAYAEALLMVGPTAADVPALLKLLREKPDGAKEAAVAALGRIGPGAKEAVPRLAELLDTGSGEVRAAAAEALGRIGPAAASAVPKLRERLTDPMAAAAARRALEQLGAKADRPKR